MMNESPTPKPREEEEVGPEWTSDETLVAAALLGDDLAFDELCHRYRPAMLRLASAQGLRASIPPGRARDIAEDAVQEGLSAAWISLDHLHQPERFAAWLSTIVRNKTKRLIKRLPADETLREERTDERSNPHQEDPLQELLDEERKAEVRAALDALPDEQRLPLELHYFDDLPIKKVALVLRLPLSTIKWRMHNARKNLKEQLTENGETP